MIMSDSEDSESVHNSIYNNPLKKIQQFRFKQKPAKKIGTINDSDENDENDSLSFTGKRKPIVIESDSDCDTETQKSSKSNEINKTELCSQEDKIKYLKDVFSHIDDKTIEKTLKSVAWDVSEAVDKLYKIRKRSSSKKHSKKLKRQKLEKDEENEGADSDEKNYTNVKVFDSDEDSDVDVSDELSGDKEAVLNFINNALPLELLLINQCSQRKVDSIIECRPFLTWRDLIKKFQNGKHLSTTILNNAQDLLRSRSVVQSLMSKCLRLSRDVEKAISDGASAIKQQPKGLPERLKLASYQMVSLNWLAVMHVQKVNAILADEMGLGKTVQVIAFLTYLKENNLISNDDGPHLIVVPCSTLDNWMNEFERWSPGLNVFKYYGSQEVRRDIRMDWRTEGLDDVDVILTTYTLVQGTPEERRLFRLMPINYAVYDEAHMLKNMNTHRYENLIRINSKSRILLTGTPLQNNLLELMSLIVFVMPSMFQGKLDEIKSLFSKNPKLSVACKSEKPIFEEKQISNAKQIMKPFILRRLKCDVLNDLPTKTEEVIECEMLEEQANLYKNLISKFSAEAGKRDEIDVGLVNNMMMQLRKIANHPLLTLHYYTYEKLQTISKRLAAETNFKQKNPDYIFEDLLWHTDYHINKLSRTYKSLAGFGIPQDLIPKSGKIRKLDDLLPTLKNEGHRILIFSQFIMVLDILEEFLTLRNMRYLRLDGSTPVAERQHLINEFNSDPGIFVFLLSTRAGGLGINLTAADTVIIHDIDFNPHNDKQAEDRCHRVGQTRPVRVIRLLSKGTLEQDMYNVSQEKLQLEQKITDNEENESSKSSSVLKLLRTALALDQNKSLSLSPTKEKNGKRNTGLLEEDEEEEIEEVEEI